MVTHYTTNTPVCSLSTRERTGSSVFCNLWSYVQVLDFKLNIDRNRCKCSTLQAHSATNFGPHPLPLFSFHMTESRLSTLTAKIIEEIISHLNKTVNYTSVYILSSAASLLSQNLIRISPNLSKSTSTTLLLFTMHSHTAVSFSRPQVPSLTLPPFGL